MTASLRENEREWVTKAACRGHDPNLWYPSRTGPNNSRAAQEICMSCPVRFECRADADSRDEPFGIWGGHPRPGTTLGNPSRTYTAFQQAPEDEPPGVFTASQCIRCGQFWSNNAGPRDNFSVVTKMCPECIGRLPIQGWSMIR